LIIGEASRRLSGGFRREHSAIPWLNITAMRNRLIHGYDEVDLNVVWNTATIDAPKLLRELEPFLPVQSD
jgi:uncharacterized protein with HEPN domain